MRFRDTTLLLALTYVLVGDPRSTSDSHLVRSGEMTSYDFKDRTVLLSKIEKDTTLVVNYEDGTKLTCLDVGSTNSWKVIQYEKGPLRSIVFGFDGKNSKYIDYNSDCNFNQELLIKAAKDKPEQTTIDHKLI